MCKVCTVQRVTTCASLFCEEEHYMPLLEWEWAQGGGFQCETDVSARFGRSGSVAKQRRWHQLGKWNAYEGCSFHLHSLFWRVVPGASMGPALVLPGVPLPRVRARQQE